MSEFIHPRYLTNFEPRRLPHLYTDTLIIGAGVAGLRAAIAAANGGDVLLITKGPVELSATSWAQGGVAAAVAPGDTTENHIRDTLATANGLGDEQVIRTIVNEAPRQIERLLQWGARFDRDGADLAIGREGGHSASRILHADGDATGRELVRVLLDQVRRNPRIRVFEHCFAIDALTAEGHALGAITFHPRFGHQFLWATTLILASGGAARVYREATTPPVATGDGLAIALRAGAAVRDLEMMQFHPTTLYVAGAARALISEAVRGEGALLVNSAGERFMPGYTADAELAPRDVVSRAIHTEMKRLRAPCVYLDARGFAPGRFEKRFPSLTRLCLDFGIDPQRERIPVRPAAHYTVGGVIAELDGRTSLDGLLACGEVASTGLHGANRLASNSLLEGLVCGERAGMNAANRAASTPRALRASLRHEAAQPRRAELDLDDVLHSVENVMSRNVAIEREEGPLRDTVEIIEFWGRYVMDRVFDEPVAWETQNLLTVAWGVAASALARRESRGVHYRSDFPNTLPEWRRHVLTQSRDGRLTVSAEESAGAPPVG